jgi:7-carboxy-7-deazaguanine synthase
VIRLLEHYPSVQGEGPRAGIPTQFVRFAGCNLKCPGWPCDTPYAIDPKLFTPEQKSVTVLELSHRIEMMLSDVGAHNVCFTGGEPMLQPKMDLEELVDLVDKLGVTMEMFSNGTIEYPRRVHERVAIVMDWKLPGSGEFGASTAVRERNWLRIRDSADHSVKFTVCDRLDLETALDMWERHTMGCELATVYVAPVWGKIEPKEIVTFMQQHRLPWRLSLQQHKFIWDPDARYT